MTVYSYSGKGNRETNEDYIRSVQFDNNTSLHIVADGMGGYLYGEIAAQVATDAIVQFISKRHSDGNITSTIQQAIEFANEEIVLKRKALHAKLGTTIAGVFIRESVAYAYWIGDVQIQHFRDNKQLFVSESHSLINEMKVNGVVSGKDIERYKNIVTKSLSGNTLDDTLPIIQLQLLPEDTLCICSDGFYSSIEVSEVIAKQDFEIDTELQLLEDTNEDNFSIMKVII
jgi:serine/threonine protein phosphatase PrpC